MSHSAALLEARSGDRRVERTRAALRAAFNHLILTKGYEGFTAADVAELANVGRSTFYEHYQSKQDILAQSIVPILAPLAESCSEHGPTPRLVSAMEHFWDNRKLARALASGSARNVTAGQLAKLIEQTLAAEPPGQRRGKPMLPLAIIAAQLASGQLSMLDEWLSGRHGCSAPEIAAALQASSYAAAGALLQRSPQTWSVRPQP